MKPFLNHKGYKYYFNWLVEYKKLILILLILLSLSILFVASRIPNGVGHEVLCEPLTGGVIHGYGDSTINVSCKLDEGDVISVLLPVNVPFRTGRKMKVFEQKTLIFSYRYSFIAYEYEEPIE